MSKNKFEKNVQKYLKCQMTLSSGFDFVFCIPRIPSGAIQVKPLRG